MKHFLLSYLLFFISYSAFAQSDLLCPEASVPTVPINSCTPTSYNVANGFGIEPPANVATGTTCVTASNVRGDGWFQFTAISTSTTIIGTVTGGRDLAIVVYTGTCGDATMLEVGGAACVNAGGNNIKETITVPTVIGTTYYIRLVKNANTGALVGTISVLTPIANDDCSDAITLTPSAPAFPPTCNQTCGQTLNATGSSPTSACAGSANDDVWYKFTATQFQHIITVGGSTSFDAVVEVLSGSCGSLTSLGCANLTAAGAVENLTYSGFVSGATYYIRVYDFLSPPPATFQFYICVTSPIPPTCPASMGGGVVNVTLPYTGAGLTTTGKADDFTAGNTITCGSSTYLQGLDGVYIFTPSSSGNISVTLTSGSTNVGIMLYDGCPFIGSSSNCVAFSQSTSGNQSFCVDVVSGNTYYLIVDRNSVAGAITSYTLSITAPPVGNNGATCGTAVPISSLPYTITGQTTLCKGDDYNNSSSSSCASLYESGEDMVFSYTTASAQCIQIALSNTSSTVAGFTVYQGCPSSASSNCLGFVGGGNVSGNFTLPASGTYYIVVDSWSPPAFVTFDLNVTSSVGNSPNDFPCNATPLPLGTTVAGDNRCTNPELPAAPSCWTTGTLNTVWYLVTPTGTSLNIKTILGTLTNTQIALYKGSCGSLTQVTPVGSSCNTDEIGCGGTTLNSQMTVTGLTPGTNYWIRVDGELNLTGTFSILAVDGNSGPPFTSQDCGAPLSVCQSNVVSSSYSGNGNYCDFGTGLNCIATGEVNSVWYTIPISSTGSLSFDIIPEDWTGGITGSDYDFAIWETGASGLTCSQLASTTPVRCNTGPLGITGCSATGNSPAIYPGFNNEYELSIPVVAGQVYKLMISNASGSSAGFTFNITSSPDPVTYPSPPSTMTWLGSTNTNWNVSSNWGSCSLPDCAVNVVCPSGPTNQPVVTTNQTVKDVTINAGSTLTINPNVTLSVCGNFINGGNLVTGAGSIIKFIGTGNQFIGIIGGGNFIGANSFANLTMQKPSGTLTLQTNIDIKENDSLLSGQLNTNAKYIRIKKNFYNANGVTTHSPVAPGPSSTYEFNGVGPQVFTNIGSEIDLNNVFMNQSPASTLTLNTGAFNNMNVKGLLTLTNGIIVTGAREVVVKNTINLAIINFNTNSYVEGNLRRYLAANATGVFDFPVGHATPGYELASVNFVAATQIPQLLAYFTPWVVVPNGPLPIECVVANYTLTQALDHGYWTINASASPNTGTYNMTLNNRSYGNAANGWTVMKRTPSGSGAWALNGTCVVTSTALVTMRNGMSGFSDFAVAQSATRLPIELLRFEAHVKTSGVLLLWETASEINNNYFNVERSSDGDRFENIGVIPGSGTTTENHTYSFTDPDPGIGIFYYRLKQIDYDGGNSYSDVVALKLNSIINEINIFPNPVSSVINFEFESVNTSKVHFQILDIMGKILIDESKETSKGNISSQIDVKELPEGIYYLKVFTSDSIYKGKFLKLNK